MDIISLFSGAGGFDLGMIQAGHRIVWANDNDPDACDTYKHNIGNHVVCDKIQNIDSAFVPRGHVVIGGFPCQGFSQANMLRSSDDSRNALYLHFKRLIEDTQPQYFLAENVRGILSLDDGNAIKTIISDFKSAGYRVKYKKFNTADYGVPQTRIRVIIAGTRCDLTSDADFVFPEPTHSQKPDETGLLPWVTIGECLNDWAEPELIIEKDPNSIYSQYKVTNRNFTGHRRTDPNKPSPTILARGNGKGGVCAIQHPRNHRRMSIRESALIQSFPANFQFYGKMNSCYRQVGNAVPVLFAKHLGKQLTKLESFSK